jgi:DNA-binding XRE family transcriptional regulator
MWDSGLRTIPRGVVERARLAVYRHLRDTELLTLDQLATETGVHQRTLRAAARTGRLTVQFSPRSAFGRPIRRATRRALIDFMARYYKKSYSRFALKPQSPVILVPTDYAPRVRTLRTALGLTQAQLAARIGAAGRAVIYQWESEKRRPSPVFWKIVTELSVTKCNRRSRRAQRRSN